MLFRLPQDSSTALEIQLYQNVSNSTEILPRLSSQDIEIAALDADLTPSTFCVLCATYSAVEKCKSATFLIL